MKWAEEAKTEIRSKLSLLDEREKELVGSFDDPTINIGNVVVGLIQIRQHRVDWLQTWKLLFGNEEI